MWRRVADRVIPAEALAGLGVVAWRASAPRDGYPGLGTVTAVPVGFVVPLSVGWRLGWRREWLSPNGFLWRPWPTISEFIDMRMSDVLSRDSVEEHTTTEGEPE